MAEGEEKEGVAKGVEGSSRWEPFLSLSVMEPPPTPPAPPGALPSELKEIGGDVSGLSTMVTCPCPFQLLRRSVETFKSTFLA